MRAPYGRVTYKRASSSRASYSVHFTGVHASLIAEVDCPETFLPKASVGKQVPPRPPPLSPDGARMQSSGLTEVESLGGGKSPGE